MSQENVEIVREAMAAYSLGDKDRWAQFMDPELETVPVPEFPEPAPLIGPDAAWDFYQRFGETIAGSELFRPPQIRRYEWDVTYTADEYLAVLDTYSGHRSMTDGERGELYRRIRRRVEARPEGLVTKSYLAILNVARTL